MHNWMQESIEIQIARQCAPVLAGVKPSNILILKDGNIAEIAPHAGRNTGWLPPVVRRCRKVLYGFCIGEKVWRRYCQINQRWNF